MLHALRKPLIPILILLTMLISGSAELCHHEQDSPVERAVADEVVMTSASCEGCCDSGHGDAHEGACHTCACFCHSTAVLVAHGDADAVRNAGRLAASLSPRQAAGFRSSLDRPPLQS